jgi:hypothetical protein
MNAPNFAPLDEAIGLLSEALATPSNPPPRALRERLLGRVGASAEKHRGLATTRVRHHRSEAVGAGMTRTSLYRADAARALRPGEPLSLALIELAPGARCQAGLGLAGHSSEWLVLHGDVSIDGVALETLDHHGRAPTPGEPVLASAGGALVYLRDGGSAPTPAGTARAAQAQWEDFAPGIRRRLLWQEGHASSYIARAVNGALVPAHGHLNDEECLMIEGDLFTGDVLLRQGDFQLAPAGLDHDVVQAGSDCLVYIRGDAELQIKA